MQLDASGEAIGFDGGFLASSVPPQLFIYKDRQ